LRAWRCRGAVGRYRDESALFLELPRQSSADASVPRQRRTRSRLQISQRRRLESFVPSMTSPSTGLAGYSSPISATTLLPPILLLQCSIPTGSLAALGQNLIDSTQL